MRLTPASIRLFAALIQRTFDTFVRGAPARPLTTVEVAFLFRFLRVLGTVSPARPLLLSTRAFTDLNDALATIRHAWPMAYRMDSYTYADGWAALQRQRFLALGLRKQTVELLRQHVAGAEVRFVHAAAVRERALAPTVYNSWNFRNVAEEELYVRRAELRVVDRLDLWEHTPAAIQQSRCRAQSHGKHGRKKVALIPRRSARKAHPRNLAA